jgi:hypothetical protein
MQSHERWLKYIEIPEGSEGLARAIHNPLNQLASFEAFHFVRAVGEFVCRGRVGD